MKRNRRLVWPKRAASMILNGLLGARPTITAPAGPFSINTNYTFSATTSLTGATFDWTNQPGVTVVSGQGTSSAVIRFTEAGVRSIVVDITAPGRMVERAAWIDHVDSFSPTSIPNLALWLDASDASTLTLDGSNNVSEWRDKSGAARHLTQGTALNRPSYVTGVLNGLPVVRPDGVNDFLQSASQNASVWYGSGTQQTTWIYLVAYLSTGRFSLAVNPSLGASSSRMLLDRQPSGIGTSDFQFTAGATGAQILSAPYLSPITAWAIETVRWTNGGTPTLRRTTTAATNTYSAPGTLTGTMADGLVVNVGYSTIVPANFNLAEWFIYSRELSDAEVAQIETYLLSKWGTI